MDVYVQEFNLFFRRNYRAKLFFVASRPYVFRLSLEIPRANLAFFISPSLYLRPWVTKPRRSIRAGNFGKREKVMDFFKDLIFDPDPLILPHRCCLSPQPYPVLVSNGFQNSYIHSRIARSKSENYSSHDSIFDKDGLQNYFIKRTITLEQRIAALESIFETFSSVQFLKFRFLFR